MSVETIQQEVCPCVTVSPGKSIYPKAFERASGNILGYLVPVFRCQSLACNLVGISQLDCWDVPCKVKGELTVQRHLSSVPYVSASSESFT